MAIPDWLTVNIYNAILIVILLPFIREKKEGGTVQNRRFYLLLWFLLAAFVVDSLGRIESADPALFIIDRIGNYLLFILDPILYFIAMWYVAGWVNIPMETKRKWFVYLKIYTILNTILVTASELFDWRLFYYFDEANVYHRSGWLFTVRAAGLFLGFFLIEVFILKYRDNINPGYRRTLIYFPIIPIIGGVLQTLFFGLALEYVGMTLSTIILFLKVQNREHTDLEVISVKQAKHIQKLKDVAMKDELTGLYNRRYIVDYINEVVQKNKGKGIFLMVDVDNFKQVNDYLGHDTGDSILKAVADSMREVCNPGDVAGRIGGDEFALFLKDAILGVGIGKKCETICERSKEEIDRIIGNELPQRVTVSIGGAIAPEDGLDFTELYNCADKALYQVKLDGKNGFDFYNRGRRIRLVNEKDNLSEVVSKILMILEERGKTTGAYSVTRDEFKYIYQYMKRHAERVGGTVQLLAFELRDKEGKKTADEELTRDFLLTVEESIRRGDVAARFQDGIIMVMLPGAEEDSAQYAVDRIIAKWMEKMNDYSLVYESRSISKKK